MGFVHRRLFSSNPTFYPLDANSKDHCSPVRTTKTTANMAKKSLEVKSLY